MDLCDTYELGCWLAAPLHGLTGWAEAGRATHIYPYGCIAVFVVLAFIVFGGYRRSRCSTDSTADNGTIAATNFSSDCSANGSTHAAANGRIKGGVARIDKTRE